MQSLQHVSAADYAGAGRALQHAGKYCDKRSGLRVHRASELPCKQRNRWSALRVLKEFPGIITAITARAKLPTQYLGWRQFQYRTSTSAPPNSHSVTLSETVAEKHPCWWQEIASLINVHQIEARETAAATAGSWTNGSSAIMHHTNLEGSLRIRASERSRATIGSPNGP